MNRTCFLFVPFKNQTCLIFGFPLYLAGKTKKVFLFFSKVLLAKSTRCFTEPEESFCGNLRVEGDEECDAGLLGSEDTDSCCDENCKLRANAKCSDKNSPCCVGKEL